MFYKEHKLYGPYLSKDGRLRIYLKYLDGTNTTISYPKYLVEKEINRILNINETIDHIDGNPLNNDLDNLRIINRKEHSIQDIKRLYDIKVKCIYCGTDFIIKGNKIRDRNRNGKSGPFCSKSCTGKYGRELQLNNISKLSSIPIERKKYKKKELIEIEPNIRNYISEQ